MTLLCFDGALPDIQGSLRFYQLMTRLLQLLGLGPHTLMLRCVSRATCFLHVSLSLLPFSPLQTQAMRGFSDLVQPFRELDFSLAQSRNQWRLFRFKLVACELHRLGLARVLELLLLEGALTRGQLPLLLDELPTLIAKTGRLRSQSSSSLLDKESSWGSHGLRRVVPLPLPGNAFVQERFSLTRQLLGLFAQSSMIGL